MATREQFGSRLGFILVSAGCAIGIGNVWKFPYITGMYGGAAFILMYLAFLVILGLPIMVCEFTVGRGSQMGMGKAFEKLEPKGTKWHHLKWISILGSYLLMMFYTMEMDLPGFSKDEVKVSLKDGYLTVKAAKGLDEESEKKNTKYIRKERYAGECERSFYVGDVKESDIKGEFKHGILTLTIPKVQPQKEVDTTKYIEIE